MKGTLEFDLPDEQEEWEHACRGRAAHLALWELDQWLRGRIKYEEDAPPVLDGVRCRLREIAAEHGVDL